MKEWMINLVVAVMAVLAPIQSIMIVVAILIGADFITGIMKAYKLKEALEAVDNLPDDWFGNETISN